MTNALSIDLEDWYQGLEMDVRQWVRFEDRLSLATEKVLSILAEHGARATFFVLGYVAERHPELVREIHARGHEVATHGYEHTFVYRQTPEAFEQEVRRSIEVIEEITREPVLGYRAPFFSITARSLWALDVLSELGLRYDTSIFPVLNYRYGIVDAPRFPYVLRSRCGAYMMEFPVSTLRFLGRNIPIAGGAYFRMFPYALVRYGIRKTNREGHPIVFYLHPWEVDPDHPRIRLPWRIGLTHYVALRSTEAKWHRLLAEFRFAPVREVLRVGT